MSELAIFHLVLLKLYLEQEVSLARCRKLVDHIYLEKCIDNEEITNEILCKGVTFGSYSPTAVLSSIFPDGRGIFHGGELNLQVLQRNNFTDLTYAGSLDGYTPTRMTVFDRLCMHFYLLPISFFGVLFREMCAKLMLLDIET